MAAAEGTHRPSTASLCVGFLRKLFAVVAFVEIDFGQASSRLSVDARCCVLGFAPLSCRFSLLPFITAEAGGKGSDGF